jgi:hypothetical protein
MVIPVGIDRDVNNGFVFVNPSMFVPAIVVTKNKQLSSFTHVQGELFDELFLTEQNMVS